MDNILSYLQENIVPIIVMMSIILTILQLAAILQKRIATRRMNKMCTLLYKEYRKVYGQEWAEETFKDVVRKVVEKVDRKTTAVIRRPAV